MKLIGSTSSPFVRKVRVVMAEKKLEYKFVLDDVWGPETTISESNPLGKVPCLLLEGGDALYDSRVIVEYVDTLSPVGRLIPERGRERAEVRTWEALADGVIDLVLGRPQAGIASTGVQAMLDALEYEHGLERGAIGVVEFEAPVPVNDLCRRFADEGVWIRPMGKVVYLTPPLVIGDDDLGVLTRAVAEVVAR